MPGFDFNELMLNQAKTSLSNSILELYKVLSSVKLLTSDIVIKNKSFINILKRKDPEIERQGTPLIVSHQELYEGHIFILCV